MRELFRSFRRKLGLGTLLLTLALMAGWFRSDSVADELLIRVQRNFEYAFLSSPDGLQWSGRRSTGHEPPTDGDQLFEYQAWRFMGEYPDLFWFEREWQWDCCGLHFGQGINPTLPRYRETYWIFPYGFVVIPLTLMSAWLLLGTPRQKKHSDATRNPQKTSEVMASLS